MAPKTKTKRKAVQANKLSVELRKKQRPCSETVESIPAGIESTASSATVTGEALTSVSSLSTISDVPGVTAETEMPTTSSVGSVAGPGTPRVMMELPDVTAGTYTPSLTSVADSGMDRVTPMTIETPEGVAAGTDMPSTSVTSVVDPGVNQVTPVTIEAPEGVAAGTDMPSTSVTSVVDPGVDQVTPVTIEAPEGVAAGTDMPPTSVTSVVDPGVNQETPITIEAPEGVTAGTDMPSTSSATSVVDPGASPAPKETRVTQKILGKFAEEWLETVDKEDLKSIAMFLCFQLVKQFEFTETKAAEYTAAMLNKGERTVRRWRSALVENDGVLPESEQGRYQRSGVLWQNDKKATEYVRANAAVKGHPNLTSADFCRWVNESLLPNSTLEPGFPRKIGLETARIWLHHLGFEVLTAQKGIFIDGHEREDVVESRKLFLRKMTKLGFLHFTNAPTDVAARALPSDVDPPTNERRSKTVFLFHDESTFMSNEDQPTQWGMKGEKMMKPKSKGAGIMVSDFIDEHNGFLALSDDEYQAAKDSNARIRPYAREFLEYGESKEGYWTRDKFITQMEQAIQIAEIKYPKDEGWRHVWVFDHSSCHAAMADDALDVSKINVKPGGKQRIMRDTTWNGKVWKMYYTDRDGKKVAKGMKMVLEERGVSTAGKGGDWMRKTLGEHFDFKTEKCMIEHVNQEGSHSLLSAEVPSRVEPN